MGVFVFLTYNYRRPHEVRMEGANSSLNSSFRHPQALVVCVCFSLAISGSRMKCAWREQTHHSILPLDTRKHWWYVCVFHLQFQAAA